MLGWNGIQVFSLLPVSWSAFPSPADQSRYSERSYCTQILLEGYIIYPTHQSMFFAFLYHTFFSMFYIYIYKIIIIIFPFAKKYYHPWRTKDNLPLPFSASLFIVNLFISSSGDEWEAGWAKIEFTIAQTTSLL